MCSSDLGYITFRIALSYENTNAWSTMTLAQPSAGSYAILILVSLVILLEVFYLFGLGDKV